MNGPEIWLLDENFELLDVVKDYSSLQWTPRYYEIGTFALQLGINYAKLLLSVAYVYRRDREDLGIVDKPAADKMCMLSGRFANAMLMYRVIDKRKDYSGTVEEICRQIVYEYCIADPDRAIPHLQLGAISGIGEYKEAVQFRGQTVHEAISGLLTEQQMSYRMRYDHLENTLFFEVFQGLDRTQNQTENSWCVFSRDFYNVLNEKFTRSTDTRNYAIVVNGDEDKNEDEITVIIDQTDGRPRREVYVTDNTKLTAEMTEEEFEAAIYNAGLMKLAEYNIADTCECEIDIGNAMDFGLGDLCTYTNTELGITTEQRITEIREVYEERNISTSIVIGRDQLTEGKKILRAVNT